MRLYFCKTNRFLLISWYFSLQNYHKKWILGTIFQLFPVPVFRCYVWTICDVALEMKRLTLSTPKYRQTLLSWDFFTKVYYLKYLGYYLGRYELAPSRWNYWFVQSQNQLIRRLIRLLPLHSPPGMFYRRWNIFDQSMTFEIKKRIIWAYSWANLGFIHVFLGVKHIVFYAKWILFRILWVWND